MYKYHNPNALNLTGYLILEWYPGSLDLMECIARVARSQDSHDNEYSTVVLLANKE